MYSSIAQYDTLFSSEGLTLLALDGMYSVKAALASYSRTRSPLRMEDAVDELHRLSDRGKDKVARDDLLEAYGWLGVPSSAVDDLDRNYKREYGVSVMSMPGTGYTSSTCQGRSRSGPLPAEGQDGGSKTATRHSEPIVVGAGTPAKPALKLRTSFGNSPDSTARAAGGEDDEPPDSVALAIQPSYPFSIDDVLSADALTPAPALATPGGHDTLSPTTRGEWRILMVDDAFKSGKTAPVEAW
ncbi:hypothetical protein GMORB2_6780 [Geosmithia morbida]|uniref:DUF7582 domain-containing protein n=1 Tax=Geosmithia morbida TaxID=1094350 RepID=A0A9P5D4Y5_9HYPO|nr:uncharacterized protein GMORB2_6780 [Geosmithia morbida]KAF4123230.1 hypothetical protein GMORB2_6780 [Geosmithia morbida]